VLALPIAVLAQAVFGPGADGVAVHVALGLGTLLAASAAFDFETPRWVRWLGFVPTALLGAVFALQALTEITQNAALRSVAYNLLGQDLEGWLMDGFFIWALAAVVLVSRGKTRLLGLAGALACVAVEVVRYGMLALGSSLSDVTSAWKLVPLLILAWLFVQSTKTAARPDA
jgi:hypothetical protein